MALATGRPAALPFRAGVTPKPWVQTSCLFRWTVTCCDVVRRQLRAERKTSPPLHGVGDRDHGAPDNV
ncbi:MAG TPA: hypothetical protein VGN26_11280, partial [Armatimonadota bacterium]